MEQKDVNSSKNPNGEVKKKSKLGLILGLSIGGGALLVGLIILLIVLLTGLKKSDWESASSKTASIYDTYNLNSSDIEESVSDMLYEVSYGSGSDLEDTIADVTIGLEKFDSDISKEIETLSNEKVIKKDKVAKEKFEKIQTAYDKYHEEINKIGVIYSDILPAFAKVNEIDFESATSIESAKTMVSDLKSLATEFKEIDTEYDDINEFALAIANGMESLATGLETVINGGSTASLQTAATDLESSVEDIDSLLDMDAVDGSEEEFMDAVDSLSDYIKSKIK